MRHQNQTKLHRRLAIAVFFAWTTLGGTTWAETDQEQRDYAASRLAAAGKKAEFRRVQGLVHREAFRVVTDDGGPWIEAATPAGFIYGAQAVARGEATPGVVERPDFDIRGTTLWIAGDVSGGRIAAYHSGFDAQRLPWFFDRPFMTRYLDALAAARYNTLFLWASHPFPYILELPEYPGATGLTDAQLRQNQEQFRWLAEQCQRRNIRVLLHFYNIHLPEKLASRLGGRLAGGFGGARASRPTPEIARYYRYILGRYFDEFAGVGLYICPGETLASSHQLEWFRDVIFKAAKDSKKNPLLVIRDWTLNLDFRAKIPDLYENTYSELKHNDESFTSPVPDRRHEQWRGVLKGHIVNLHGPPMDLQPMRWASPAMIRETVANWRDMGYVKGAEIYALSCFDWPYTQDKLTPDQFGYREQVKGPKLLWLDRSGIYLDVFGRYLWKTERAQEDERKHWEQVLSEKFLSPEVGKHVYRWYVVTGPISPGMQNLTAVKFGNFWATVMLQNQGVDQILAARKRIDDVPITLTQEAGRTRQIYYSQPVDTYFFERYKDRYDLPELTERLSMPVAQYAEALAAGREVTEAMTPDKVCDLLCELAEESLEAARAAQAAAPNPDTKAELGRFVTDSRMYVLATRALRHKVNAAILKARMTHTGQAHLVELFRDHVEQSVTVYEELAELTGRTYRNANDLMGRHWNREGLAEFRNDLAAQLAWLEGFQPLPEGAIRVEAEAMTGPWRIGSDRYTGFSGTGYAASYYAAAAAKPDPMTASVRIPADGEYNVWIRALAGGEHQDRALAVELASRRFEATHAGEGPPGGAFTWQRAGSIQLSAGAVELKVHPVGKRHPAADAVLLTPDAHWRPDASQPSKP